eukprot:Skav209475  [mRNA]  locus=scaffold1892:7926:8535:+ [translate_table: standard]
MVEQVHVLEQLHQLEQSLKSLAPKLAPSCVTVEPKQIHKVLEQLYPCEGAPALMSACGKSSTSVRDSIRYP